MIGINKRKRIVWKNRVEKAKIKEYDEEGPAVPDDNAHGGRRQYIMI